MPPSPISDIPSFDRTQLRQQLRTARRQLAPSQQLVHALVIAQTFLASPLLAQHQTLALYWPNDGEVTLEPLWNQLWDVNKDLYLPILDPQQPRQLFFAPFTPTSQLQKNAYGIAEPQQQDKLLTAQQLDLVLMPLVGFDRLGNRLGMGGGFYDSSFAFKKDALHKKPFLCGVAHACQEVSLLATNSWDIPIDAVITEQEMITCTNHRQ